MRINITIAEATAKDKPIATAEDGKDGRLEPEPFCFWGWITFSPTSADREVAMAPSFEFVLPGADFFASGTDIVFREPGVKAMLQAQPEAVRLYDWPVGDFPNVVVSAVSPFGFMR